MKTRWDFKFEYEDLEFERVFKYEAEISNEMAKMFGFGEQGFKALIRIEAEEKEHGKIKQYGKIQITLPGYAEETRDLAYSLVETIGHNVTFLQGKIEIIGSFVSNELLPETPEEAEAVGDKRFSYFMQMQEVPASRPFDGSDLQKLTANPLLVQFNNAEQARDPIDQYIGFFKILEDLYGPSSRSGLADAFKNSVELIDLARENLETKQNGANRQMTVAEIHNLLDELVQTRHQCAHLRSAKGFGISYGDPRVKKVVTPLLTPLKILAYASVESKVL